MPRTPPWDSISTVLITGGTGALGGLVGRHLVAVNGDAISINDVYRDGSLIWNVHEVPFHCSPSGSVGPPLLA